MQSGQLDPRSHRPLCSRSDSLGGRAGAQPNRMPCANGRSFDQFTVFVWRRM